MKKYAADNLMLLRKSYPKIYETIRNRRYDSDVVQISHNRSDQVVLQIADGQGRLHAMYSRYDVGVEVERWLESIENEVQNTDHVLFFGLGLGYHLQAFIEKYPAKSIYIYEPDENILMAAIECVDLRPIFRHKFVHIFALGKDEHTQFNLVRAIFDTIKGSIATIILPAYKRMYADTIKQFQETLSRNSLSYQANLQTMSGLQIDWAENIILNMEKVMNSYSFAPMKDSLKDIPAVIVGSGPSLDMEIDWLRKLKNKVLIVAAGSSIQGLLYNDIVPDLVVSMDPRSGNLAIFNNVSNMKVPFLFIPTVHSAILDKEWELTMHALFTNDELTKFWMDDIKTDLVPPQFFSSGTVSGTAIQAAVYLGCSEIVLIGQDFSYPEDRHYAQGVTHKSEKVLKEKVERSDLEVENVMGGYNKTSQQMKVLKLDVEALLKVLEIKKAYNASKIGAKIEHTKTKTLEELYYEYEQQNLGEGWFLKLLSEKLTPYSESDKRLLTQKIKRIEVGIEELNQIVVRLKQQLTATSKLHKDNRSALQKWLADFNKEWTELVNHELFSRVYKFLLFRENNYVSRFWSDIHAGKDDWLKIQQIPPYAKIIIDGYERVTHVLTSSLDKLNAKLNSIGR